jgi:phage terminase small subunit
MLAANFVFDTTKAKDDLGWTPTKTNLEMLCEAYSYYVEHRDDIRKQKGLSPHRSPARAGIINLLRMIS